MSGEPELKPCPFCGGAATYQADHTTECVDSIYCGTCGVSVSDFSLDGPQGSCRDLWNTRANDAQAARLAALEAERDNLREALQPFARIASEPAVKNARKSRKSYIHAVLLVAFLDAALRALAETEDQTNDG